MLLVEFYRSTIGKKILMALSGVVLFLFVIGHMAGNTKMFFGIDPLLQIYRVDHYGELLRTIGADFLGRSTVLWIVRVVLFISIVIHIVTGTQLWLLNRKARGASYERMDYDSATISSRTMFYGGVFLGLFAVYHVLQFTTGQAYPGSFEQGKVYANLYYAFKHGWLVLVYVVSMLFLALHIYHGGWSLFQTLGLDTPRINPGLRLFAKVMAVLLFVGFSAVPAAVYFEMLPPPVAADFQHTSTERHSLSSQHRGTEAQRHSTSALKRVALQCGKTVSPCPCVSVLKEWKHLGEWKWT